MRGKKSKAIAKAALALKIDTRQFRRYVKRYHPNLPIRQLGVAVLSLREFLEHAKADTRRRFRRGTS